MDGTACVHELEARQPRGASAAEPHRPCLVRRYFHECLLAEGDLRPACASRTRKSSAVFLGPPLACDMLATTSPMRDASDDLAVRDRSPSAARREIVSSRALARETRFALDSAASTDALERRSPGGMHRSGWLATIRITWPKLAALNRLADFRLRSELASLYGDLSRTARSSLAFPSPRHPDENVASRYMCG